MIRIILGAFILLAMLGQFAAQKAPVFTEMSEMQGYIIAQIAFAVLAIWLIASGIKKRRARKLATKVDEKAGEMKKEKMPLTVFLKSFFGDYKDFLHKNIEHASPPYWLSIVWLYGIARVAVRFNTGMGTTFNFQGWLAFWLATLFLGAFIGLIGYWIVGSIFHLGVLLAGGHKKAKVSRMIYVYCWLPYSLAIMITFLAAMLGLRENYFLNGGMGAAWFHPATAVSLYSIILGYIGTTEIQKTKKVRSILLFLILPILLHAAVFLYAYRP